jgi:hypothetical protein
MKGAQDGAVGGCELAQMAIRDLCRGPDPAR